MAKLVAFVVVVLLALAVMGYSGLGALEDAAGRVDGAVMYTVRAADAVPQCGFDCLVDKLAVLK